MGALHPGHLSLMERCRAECKVMIVSIFVNPTQFGEQSDLDNYPRTLEADSALCEEAGVDIIFAPSPAEVYPQGFATSVHVSGVTDRWEGEQRPGHFDGVATVVAKLFGMAMPERAYFGDKDFQQLALIRRMTQDLNLPVEIIGCPTVRERAGLAMSSRNIHLSNNEFDAALCIPMALQAALSAAQAGEQDPGKLAVLARQVLSLRPELKTEYLAIVDPHTLEPRSGAVQDGDRIIAAVRCGAVRLIDNMELRLANAEQAQDAQEYITGTRQ
jgi:pantoate--beta-alanine ligase